MHKKLETDLMSLAHSILQMKNKENVFLLKQKASEIYEKLSVLAFVEEYVNSTPNLKETKQELNSKVEKAFEIKDLVSEEIEEVIEEKESEAIIHQLEKETFEVQKEELEVEVEESVGEEEVIVKESIAEITESFEVEEPIETEITAKDGVKVDTEIEMEQPFDDFEKLIFGDAEPESTSVQESSNDEVERKALTLEEELEDTISVDVIADLFESAKPTSLNNKLQTNIQIGLNDRIIFVKNLFEGSQEDFNRVISQLNTFKTEKEAKKFITKMVKPDYNWSDQEDLELRLMDIIERRFA